VSRLADEFDFIGGPFIMQARSVVAVTILLAAPLSVHANEYWVPGSVLQVKNPSTPEKRSVVVKAKAAGYGASFADDPSVTGGSLVVRAIGTASESQQNFPLPAGVSSLTGRPFWTVKVPGVDYRYDDPLFENGPVRKLKVKVPQSNPISVQVQAIISGKAHPVVVVPPNPGVEGCARLEIGDGDAVSIAFTTGSVGNKENKLFKVTKAYDVAYCAPLPTTTSTSSSSTTTSTSSTTSTTSTTLCTGVSVGGACWFVANGTSCDTECADNGLTYDEATRTYAGSDGTDAGCAALATAFSLPYTGSNVTDVGVGCFFDFEGGGRRDLSPTTSAASAVVWRFCACQ